MVELQKERELFTLLEEREYYRRFDKGLIYMVLMELLQYLVLDGRMYMSKLIILRGNSGSGKTTVSKLLQEKFGRNTMLISHDMVRRQILHAKDAEALPLIMQLLKYGRQNSDITILEGILPVEETLQRHATKPNKADFGEQDMRRWWKEKDFINIILEKVITQNLSISDTVDMICKLVS